MYKHTHTLTQQRIKLAPKKSRNLNRTVCERFFDFDFGWPPKTPKKPIPNGKKGAYIILYVLTCVLRVRTLTYFKRELIICPSSSMSQVWRRYRWYWVILTPVLWIIPNTASYCSTTSTTIAAMDYNAFVDASTKILVSTLGPIVEYLESLSYLGVNSHFVKIEVLVSKL